MRTLKDSKVKKLVQDLKTSRRQKLVGFKQAVWFWILFFWTTLWFYGAAGEGGGRGWDYNN